MMINLSLRREAFERARTRAHKIKMRAEALKSDGELVRVASASVAGRWHLVEMFVKDGDILASCDCAAGSAAMVCHHMAAAAEKIIGAAALVSMLDTDEITATEIDVD